MPPAEPCAGGVDSFAGSSSLAALPSRNREVWMTPVAVFLMFDYTV
jgi:hypothetical protein